MKYIFLCLFNFLSFSNWAFSIETREFDIIGIKRLEISNPKGEILVIASPNTKKIIVTINKIAFDIKCHFNLVSGFGTITAKIEHDSAFFDKANCVSNLKIEIPTKLLNIDVSSGSANIKLVNLNGAIDFSTATGGVEITGGILKNIDGKTATSNMRFSYNKCPSRADINIASASGDTEIFLPAICKIRVSYKSATGELFNELGDAEDYQVHINSKSATGNLKVRKLQK